MDINFTYLVLIKCRSFQGKNVKKVNFAERSSIEFVEERNILAPKFNSDAVIPVVVTETSTVLVLMLAYMNIDALDKTILTNES